MFCPGEELCILLFNAEVNVTTEGRHKKDVIFVLIRRAFSWAFHQMCSTSNNSVHFITIAVGFFMRNQSSRVENMY